MAGVSEEGEATGEQNDIKRMMKECEQWAKMSNLLLQELGAVHSATLSTTSKLATTTTTKKTIEEIDEDVTAKETDTVDEQPQETSSSRDGVQLVGEDENVHLKPLEEMIDKTSSNVSPAVSPAKLELVEEDTIPLHSSVSNYDAENLILQVDKLENTIKEQSDRVQEAEQLAEESTEQLKLAMERITELEAELADMKKVKEGRNTSGGKGKKSVTRKTSSKVSESPVKKKTN